MNLNKLDEKLNELKNYSKKRSLKSLNKLIYSLKLTKEKLSRMTKEEIIYSHVKIHNALSYKKPFAKFEDLKKQHDLIAKHLENHKNVDKLDL